MTDALPLFDRALAVTEADPALTDLRLLLQINKAVTLGNLDRYEEALAAAGQARQLADQVGTAIRLAQAHGALGQLLFETGRWDDALAEVESLPENLKEPAVACCDLGIAAVIGFHRGETGAARRHLAAAVPHAKRIGHRLIGPLAAGPQPGPRAGRRAAGGAGRADRRRSTAMPRNSRRSRTCWPTPSGWPPGPATWAPPRPWRATPRHSPPGRRSRTGRRTRCTAAACSTTTPPGCSRPRSATTTPAGRCSGPRRWRRPPGTSSTPTTATRRGPRSPRPSRSTPRWARPRTSARLQAAFRAHGIRRGPHAKHRRAQSGWDSLTATEIKIAAFVEEGLSNPEIAARLLLSRRTVATHVSHILKKLNVNSRIDIARESALRTVPPR